MVICVYALTALLFKNPLPAAPLLILYMVYSNMGSVGPDGTYGHYGRPLAIMVQFSGAVSGYCTAAACPHEPDRASFCVGGNHMDMCEIMEKKEGLRVKEIKISLPLYKILCAFFFVLILAIVRGVTDVNEIGPKPKSTLI